MQNQTAPHTRNIPDDIDVDALASAVVLPVCDRLGVAHYAKGRHVAAVILDMVSLDANGANDAELMSYGLMLIEVAKTLKSQHAMDDRTLARMQLDADCRDDHMRGVMAIEGESPATLEALAAAWEQSAALNVTSARRARKRARQIRTTRGVAQQRIGLNGAA